MKKFIITEKEKAEIIEQLKHLPWASVNNVIVKLMNLKEMDNEKD